MKMFLAVFALALVPTLTFADSFNCDSSASDHLHVLVQNNVDPSAGTRTAAFLLVTDTEAAPGSQTLISSNKIVQNGAFWTIDTTNYAKDTTPVQIGDFDRSQLSEIQVYLPTFNFSESNKDGEQYAGHLFLYQVGNSDIFSQDVELNCVYTRNN